MIPVPVYRTAVVLPQHYRTCYHTVYDAADVMIALPYSTYDTYGRSCRRMIRLSTMTALVCRKARGVFMYGAEVLQQMNVDDIIP